MNLMEIETILPYPIEDVFALTVDLEKAPRWHRIFTGVKQLNADPVGKGSRWQIDYAVSSFELEIIDYRPPHQVTFRGSHVTGGTVPNFTIELQTVPDGTQLRYIIHPEIPSLLRLLMKTIAPPYGRRDLARYFRELETMLAASPVVTREHPKMPLDKSE